MDYYGRIPGEPITFQMVNDSLDPVVRCAVHDCNAMIVGEAIVSAIKRIPISRYDIICRDESTLSEFCRYIDNTVSSYREETPCNKLYVSSSHPTICVSKRFFHNDDAEYVIDALSGFTINGCIYYKDGLYTHPQFLEHLDHKELVLIESSHYPIPLIMSIPQYLRKGYNISQSELFKLAMMINQMKSFDYSNTVLNNLAGVGIDISNNVKYFKTNSEESFVLRYVES